MFAAPIAFSAEPRHVTGNGAIDLNYPSGATAELGLLRRTIAGVLDFKGRSCRTEVLLYQFAVALVGVTLGFAGSTFLPHAFASTLIVIVRVVTALPLVALFARRLHDQNRSAWWTLILPVGMGLNIVRHESRLVANTPSSPPWLGLAYVCVVILMLVLFYWPGTRGPNRFGSDPREA